MIVVNEWIIVHMHVIGIYVPANGRASVMVVVQTAMLTRSRFGGFGHSQCAGGPYTVQRYLG
jgi:hypothetical protein